MLSSIIRLKIILLLVFLFNSTYSFSLSDNTQQILDKIKKRISSETPVETKLPKPKSESTEKKKYFNTALRPQLTVHIDNSKLFLTGISTEINPIEPITRAKNAVNTYVPNPALKNVLLVPLNIGNNTKEYFKRTLDMDLGYEDHKVLLLKKSKW